MGRREEVQIRGSITSPGAMKKQGKSQRRIPKSIWPLRTRTSYNRIPCVQKPDNSARVWSLGPFLTKTKMTKKT